MIMNFGFKYIIFIWVGLVFGFHFYFIPFLFIALSVFFDYIDNDALLFLWRSYVFFI